MSFGLLKDLSLLLLPLLFSLRMLSICSLEQVKTFLCLPSTSHKWILSLVVLDTIQVFTQEVEQTLKKESDR